MLLRLHTLTVVLGRWFHLRGLQEPLSLPHKKWPGPAYFPCAHMYVRTYNWASEALDYVWPATGEIETNFMRRGCFFITLASQEFYGGASPWSRCVSYATVSHRTSSLSRPLRGRQPLEPPWFLRHCLIYTWLYIHSVGNTFMHHVLGVK